MSRLSELLQRATARVSGPWGAVTKPRMGVMLHYSAGTDVSGVEWLLFDPRCQVSYNWLVLDDGTVVNVAPKEARAWHAGDCRPSDAVYDYHDANSSFYGLAIAAEDGDVTTPIQFDTVVQMVTGLFREHHWPADQVRARLTDHAAEAWPRGRKHDTNTVLPLRDVQTAVIGHLIADEVGRMVVNG